jgi:hypothetical protein
MGLTLPTECLVNQGAKVIISLVASETLFWEGGFAISTASTESAGVF